MKTGDLHFSTQERRFEAVVMGASAGGGEALAKTLCPLPADYAVPILVVQHLHPHDDEGFAESLGTKIPLIVVVPCDKQQIEAGRVYVAPANYHMLVERNGFIALSTEARVHYSRPSIDVLFESAGYAWDARLIAIILTGANGDGAAGMQTVKGFGGLTIAQDPATAEYPVMPQEAINTGAVDEVLTSGQIAERLIQIGTGRGHEKEEA